MNAKREATYADPNAVSKNAKYNGLKSTAMASFHPSTTSRPYIQYGICATLETMLRFAST